MVIGELIEKKAKTTELVIGIRPEHMDIVEKPDENSIKAEVYVIEPLGAETVIDVKIGSRIFKIVDLKSWLKDSWSIQ